VHIFILETGRYLPEVGFGIKLVSGIDPFHFIGGDSNFSGIGRVPERLNRAYKDYLLYQAPFGQRLHVRENALSQRGAIQGNDHFCVHISSFAIIIG
jgi:hypothetical protein